MSDIQAIFQKDPLGLTKDDLDAEIAYYRSMRHAFNLGDKQAGSTKRMKGSVPDEKIKDLDALLSDL